MMGLAYWFKIICFSFQQEVWDHCWSSSSCILIEHYSPLQSRYTVHAASLNYLYFRGKRELGDLWSHGKISLCQTGCQKTTGTSFLTLMGLFRLRVLMESSKEPCKAEVPLGELEQQRHVSNLCGQVCTSGNKETFYSEACFYYKGLCAVGGIHLVWPMWIILLSMDCTNRPMVKVNQMCSVT